MGILPTGITYLSHHLKESPKNDQSNDDNVGNASSKSSIASPEGYIRWNSDRVYGTERLQHLMANWDVLGLYPGWEMSFPLYSQAQPVFVLQKQKL